MAVRLPVYVAGSSRETARARAFAERLQETGLVRITLDWWRHVEANGVGKDAGLSLEAQADYASGDLMAVSEARVFVALWPETPSEGLCHEHGYAQGIYGMITVVSGAHARRCIFAALATSIASDDDEAFNVVIDVAKSYARKPLPDVASGKERPR